MASVPPIIGIYTAFFPVMMYIIFGTSKHASMGTFAVVSILTSKPIIEHCHNNPMLDENKIAECAVGIMSTITFLTGGLMLCLGNIIFLLIINLFSFIIVEFSFHAEKKKFIVWRSENLFSCPRAGKQAVFQL